MTEKLDSTNDPEFVKVKIDLLSNEFLESQANYQGSIASAGSGGVFFINAESLDLEIGGGTYTDSEAYYGGAFYIETYAN